MICRDSKPSRAFVPCGHCVCVHRAGIVLNGTAAADAPIAGKLYSFHFMSSFSQKLRGLPVKFGGGVPTGWPVGHGKPWLSLGIFFGF